ncbi:MAG: tetratricopeptide repeat protein [Anaerolineae bacterium]|nr:MAG: tetratricopeptide repeat protein [Anaerolineae bacterium]
MSTPERRERVLAFTLENAPEQKPRLPLLNALLRVDFPQNELTTSLTPTLRQQNLGILVGALLLSRPGPLTLVFEDAHWMDSLSWELLIGLLHSLEARQHPAMVVLALRPLGSGHPHRQHLERLYTQIHAQRIRLGALPPHALQNLVASRLGVAAEELPAPLLRLVQRRSEGNPFYVEELLHTLQEKRLIWVEQTIRGPRCILSADFERGSQTIPPTLQGLILARIDKMPPERQLVLKVASVIGRTFAYSMLADALQRILPSVLSNLQQELALLTEQDITQEESPHPNLTYVFKHIITQETAYQTLLFSQRRQLHRLVAEWYEQHFTPDQNGFLLPLLVHHYHHAEDPHKEKLYARMAGEQALRQHAHTEALAYFRRALELSPPTEAEERFEILLGLEECYHWMGNRKSQENILREIETAAALMQRPNWQARGALRRARYGRVVGDYDAVIKAARQVLALFPQSGFHRYKAQAHYEWGNALWQHGAYDEAMEHLEQALHLNDDQPNSPIRVLVLKGLGALYNERGENENARACYEQALHVARTIGDRRGEAAALGNLGNLISDQGDHLRAREFYLQALEIYREVSSWRAQSMVLNNLGALAYYLGNYTEAQDFYEQSLHIKWKIEDRPGEGMTYANLSGLFYAMGDTGNALAYNDKALEILCDLELPFWEGLARQWRGDTYLTLEAWDEAVQTFQQCVELRRAQGHAGMLLESLAGLAAAQAGTGALNEAQATLDEVLPRLDMNTLEGAVDPLRVYWRTYEVLKALHSSRAAIVLEAATQVLTQRARAIYNTEARRMFLENVPEHRALLAHYRHQYGESAIPAVG